MPLQPSRVELSGRGVGDLPIVLRNRSKSSYCTDLDGGDDTMTSALALEVSQFLMPGSGYHRVRLHA